MYIVVTGSAGPCLMSTAARRILSGWRMLGVAARELPTVECWEACMRLCMHGAGRTDVVTMQRHESGTCAEKGQHGGRAVPGESRASQAPRPELEEPMDDDAFFAALDEKLQVNSTSQQPLHLPFCFTSVCH